MQAALNILGYSCYHSSAFFSNIHDCDMWNAAMDAKFRGKGPCFTRADWDQLLGAYSAVSADPPAVAFAADLIAAYPAAQVILVEREIEAWYRSFDRTVVAAQWNRVFGVAAALDPVFLGPIKRCHRRWATHWMGAPSAATMRATARQAYRDHYALVRRVTPPARLLEYRLGDGWPPLCAFLDKPVPDVPFPRVNDAEALQELLMGLVRRGLYNAAWRATKFLVCFAILGAGIWLACRRF